MIYPNADDPNNYTSPDEEQDISEAQPVKRKKSTEEKSLKQKVDRLGDFSLNLLRTIPLWRLFGYVLMILFVIDLADILIPPRFLNPQWEFQALGQIVERIPIPFISLILIFYGGKYARKGWENLTLPLTSWLCLFAGIIFILLVPLGVVNTYRIDQQTNERITNQTNERLTLLQRAQDAVDNARTRDELQAVLNEFSQGNAPEIVDNVQQAEAKAQLNEFINTTRNQVQTRADNVKKQTRLALIKRSVKWNLGALISGALFVGVWKMTRWARVRD